jgi:hypothetical protein|tara:strand:- start:583 stop:1041 length:459 start_codon:yes stop_codon:yes gene_type:complete
MAALSDYLESGLLNFVFRGQSFSAPSNISIALTSGAPQDSHTGSTIPELASGVDPGNSTGYSRVNIGAPSETTWSYSTDDYNAGSGTVRNSGQIVFNTALVDWGWVSGVAIVDSSLYGSGNVLMHATLDNPRIIYAGDNVKFDYQKLEISFK